MPTCDFYFASLRWMRAQTFRASYCFSARRPLDSILKGRCSVYSSYFMDATTNTIPRSRAWLYPILLRCVTFGFVIVLALHISHTHTHVFVITIFHENCHIDAERGGRAAISLTETHLRRFQRLASQHASERFVKIKRCGCWGYHRSLLFFWKITDSRWLTLQWNSQCNRKKGRPWWGDEHIYIYIYMHITYMHACLHTYIHTYIHTHM